MGAELRIYRSLEEARGNFGPCALTIGNFDGVHAGHRRILRRVVELARRHGWKPAAITFHPHPTLIVAPQRAPRLLTTPEERCFLMQQEGIEQVLILPFTLEFSRLSPEAFARDVLVEALEARAVLVGENFRFGYQHAGDTRRLEELGRQLGFLTEALDAVKVRGRLVSSSEIRRLVEAGAVAVACRLLERPHWLEGDVSPGQGIGSRLTAPTLNLAPGDALVPAPGVYVTRTTDLADGRRRPSVTNVGCRPTFGGGDLTVETFVLAPLEQKPRRIRVEFLRRLREERKFPDAAALRAQILRDAERARTWYRRLERWGRRSPL